MQKILSPVAITEDRVEQFAPAPYIEEMIEDRLRARRPLRPSDLRAHALAVHSLPTGCDWKQPF